VLRQEPRPCFYFYRQVMRQHAQTGLVAVASCEDYLRGVIKKHELTRPDKEDDRVRHIETLSSQTGPVFLVYKANPLLDELTARYLAEKPDIDFTATDRVRHTAWVVSDAKDMKAIEEEFARMDALYIADGHHRSAAAARVYSEREASGESAWFLSVIFPHNQVQILPYNRVLKDLNGLSAAQLKEKLEQVFTLQPRGHATPKRKHELGLFVEGAWHTIRFQPKLIEGADPINQLDVTLLQKHVLDPIFGISDPRTSKRISFVGGIRGTAELEKLVNSGEYACAFSMFPTSIDDLMAIADANGIMPPKSTWFEPKLRDGLLIHMI